MGAPSRMMGLEKLPDEILIEIFVRLPSESIYIIKCVSKKLCKIVDTQLFATLHQLSAAAAAAEVPRLVLTIQSDYPDRGRLKGFSNTLQLLKYDSCTSSFGNVSNSHSLTNIFFWSNVQVRCVFRNLFCFANQDRPVKGMRVQHSCFLFNPLPGNKRGGQVLILPSVQDHWEPFSWYGMGMGFDLKTNTLKIKIVGISLLDDRQGFAAYIYELGTNSSWRQIPSVPPEMLGYFMGVSAFGNMFYWFRSMAGRRNCIISFDFNQEEFSWTPHPDFNGGGSVRLHLLNLKGSLAAVDMETPSNHIEIWVLTDPNKDWTLDYKIQRDVCLTGPDRGRLMHCGEWEHGLFFVEYHVTQGQQVWSDAIFLDLRCSDTDSIKRVFFPKEFGNTRRCFKSAGRLLSFTGSTISLKHYGSLLEAKEGEWHIGKAKTACL